MDILQILLDQAIEAADEGDDEKAIAIYEDILSQREDWSAPHFNLGLIYKYQCDWEKSYYHNNRAVELDTDHQGSRWNLGIAATMLGDWKVARQCWNVFGMNYEIIDEDTAGNLGISPIRINPDGEDETVWATRICPARAVINSIPLPESDHCFKDMVLNDGAPNGYRLSDGKEYAVFNEIQHLTSSIYRTFSIKCKSLNENDFNILRERCNAADIAVENWTTGLRLLCRQCSEGRPHEAHDHDLEDTSGEHLIAFASTSLDRYVDVVSAWSDETGIECYESLYYD